MTDILAEVDEAMRRERVEKLWRQHGKTALLLLGMIVLGTAIGSAWRHWNNSVNATQTAALMEMIDSAEFPGNIESGTEDFRPGLRGIGLLTAAGAYLKQDKPDEALALYEQAASSAAPDDLRHLAIIMSVRLHDDKGTDQDLIAMLSPVIKSKTSPWRYHARMQAADLSARKGDYETANAHLNTVLDANEAPESMMQRARALQHVYTLKQYGQTIETAPAQEKDTQ
jgi:hypothetical protein